MIFTTGSTGQRRERHIEGVPSALTIVAPTEITGDAITIEADIGGSAIKGYAFSVAEKPVGPAIKTSGDRAIAGEAIERLVWNFTGIATDEPSLWVRLDYWTDPERRTRALRMVPVNVDSVPPGFVRAWIDSDPWIDSEPWLEG